MELLSEVRGEEQEGPWACQRCMATFRRRDGTVGPYQMEDVTEKVLCASCCRAILAGAPVKRVEEILAEKGLWPLPRVGPGGG